MISTPLRPGELPQGDDDGDSNNVANAVSTWFGCGYSPVAPGTAGSLAAVAIALLVAHYVAWDPPWFAVLAAASRCPASGRPT